MAGSPGSRAFPTRPTGLVAVAVHGVAVELHRKTMDTNTHKGDELSLWKDTSRRRRSLVGVPSTWSTSNASSNMNGTATTTSIHKVSPTVWDTGLKHEFSVVSSCSTDGTLKLPARSRYVLNILLQFHQWFAHQPNAIYSHSDRQKVTYRIWQLLDSQKQRLLDFPKLEHEDVQIASPLPILCSHDNRRRIDPEEPLSPNDPDRRLRDVNTSLDWPTFDDWNESRQRAFERKWAIDYPDYTSGSD
ncbi:Uncharacterized protein TPAR_05420 [Tolypocladium paradoxum]|uniref:Uncharacterized protein n=1 Tax=Tolypocladium paradoxum TaxID=94208 RepID=A0A2S4KVZ1_9HYPO|nr:Uncharacterized protein TPAR_05420 [Tolypocladium paradoxum]